VEVKSPVSEVDSNSPKFKEGVTSKGAKIDEEEEKGQCREARLAQDRDSEKTSGAKDSKVV
jgi:hypothetical protein